MEQKKYCIIEVKRQRKGRKLIQRVWWRFQVLIVLLSLNF